MGTNQRRSGELRITGLEMAYVDGSKDNKEDAGQSDAGLDVISIGS